MNRLREQFLLHRIRTHRDLESFRELYEFYVRRIWRYVGTKVPTGEVEELVADVFEQTLTYILDTPVRHMNALLYKVARRVIADFYRTREGKVMVDLGEARELADGTPGADTLTDTQLDMERVMRALQTLQPAYREVLQMRFMDGLEIQEMAAALQKTSGTVRVTVHRAVAALKATLARQASTLSTQHDEQGTQSSPPEPR